MDILAGDVAQGFFQGKMDRFQGMRAAQDEVKGLFSGHDFVATHSQLLCFKHCGAPVNIFRSGNAVLYTGTSRAHKSVIGERGYFTQKSSEVLKKTKNTDIFVYCQEQVCHIRLNGRGVVWRRQIDFLNLYLY